ncbi:MAG: DUF4290 domain-containing protein [Salinivirgaceae bacterium]|jgi:hypothetical protein
MDYNTSRRGLVLPEYGRNIQRMVNHVKSIEDPEERNRLAKAVIQIMGTMNPHLRDVADFKHKLWDHLAIISDFELDVDSPYPKPTREQIYQKPQRLKYSHPDDIRFKHYGRVLEQMIAKAITFEEGEEKNYLIEVILNQMKKSFLTWNRDTVNDELIYHDLLVLSRNRLKVPEGIKLKETKEFIIKTQSAPKKIQPSNYKKNIRMKK